MESFREEKVREPSFDRIFYAIVYVTNTWVTHPVFKDYSYLLFYPVEESHVTPLECGGSFSFFCNFIHQ